MIPFVSSVSTVGSPGSYSLEDLKMGGGVFPGDSEGDNLPADSAAREGGQKLVIRDLR